MSTPVIETATYADAVAAIGRGFREGQRELVDAGTGLQPGQRLLVKAPTATGKSLAAFLIAGFRHQQDPDNRTVIATYTKLLQDQYASTDPELLTDLDQAAALFPDMTIAVLKGANNYLCRARAARSTVPGAQKFSKETGDPGEVNRRPALRRLSADAKLCGKHTPDECGYAAAKDRARQAACVITNHALVLVNSVNSSVLGQHTLLIVDEIHNFSPRAAESFATTDYDLRELEDEERLAGDVTAQRAVARIAAAVGPGDERSDRVPTVTELQKMADILDAPGMGGRLPTLRQWVLDAVRYHRKQEFAALATVARQPRIGADRRVLRSTAVDLAPVAAKALGTSLVIPSRNEDTPDTRFQRAVLMMSATTGTPTRPTHVADRCGVPGVPLLCVTPALDYAAQMRITVTEPPRDRGWGFPEAARALCDQTGGRSLVLCRSWAMVKEVTSALEEQDGYRVLSQDQTFSGNNAAIVRQFRADETSVLVGTASFFEGIDVPTGSLSQVIITQLPIPMDFDPISAERKRRAGSRYRDDHQIPSTALVLEQMMGRLIRATTDTGLVVVLDPNAGFGWGRQAVTDATAAFGAPLVPRRQALDWWTG